MKKTVLLDSTILEYTLLKSGDNEISFEMEGESYSFSVRDLEDKLILTNHGENTTVLYARKEEEILLSLGVKSFSLKDRKARRERDVAKEENPMVSPMPGKILKILVSQNDEVSKGDILMIIEAMKMEYTIKASHSGLIENIPFQEGDLVENGVPLLHIK